MNDLYAPRMVDDDWFARFAKELRVRGATGHELGEAVASVDEYCRSSGQRAGDAFGDPVAYAASLSGGHPRRAIGIARLVLPVWLWLLAMLSATDLPVRSATTLVPFDLAYPLAVACWALGGVVMMLTGRMPRQQRLAALAVIAALVVLAVHTIAHLNLPVLFHAPVWAGWLAFALSLALLVAVVRVTVLDRAKDPRPASPHGPGVPGQWWPAVPWIVAGVPLIVFLLRCVVAR